MNLPVLLNFKLLPLLLQLSAEEAKEIVSFKDLTFQVSLKLMEDFFVHLHHFFFHFDNTAWNICDSFASCRETFVRK